MICPKCKCFLPDVVVLSAAGAIRQKLKQKFTGGRPLSTDRCHCGKYSIATAIYRKHQCEKPNVDYEETLP